MWYTTRTYYRVSLATPIVLGILLAVYTLLVDRISPCSDPFGIIEACLESESCSTEHCLPIDCNDELICVPDVKSICFIGKEVLEPGKCPMDHYPYVLFITGAYIAIVLIIAFLYISTRLYINIKASETYDRYPSVVRDFRASYKEICPTCGTHGVMIGVECTNCRGTGMHEGTMSPIQCEVCNGKGRIVKISPN